MVVPAGPVEVMDSVVPVLPRRAVMLVLYPVLLDEMIDQPPSDSALS